MTKTHKQREILRCMENEYKNLRDIVILERYLEKETGSIIEEPEESLQNQLNEVFNAQHIQSLNDLLNNI